MQTFEENEISENSKGGTEISKRTISKYVPEELAGHFQVIASRVRNLQEDKIRIYWQHDLPEDPEVNHLSLSSSRKKFHKFVFVSNWQLNEYNNKLKFPYDNKSIVIENPIVPIEHAPKPEDKINLIYMSTPQRGLDILVPVFEELAKKHTNIHLNVFSSFEIYGWKEADAQFEHLYERIRQHPQMTYHGFAEQETIREYLQQSHILAYPNIWKETSCRVLIESMSAGLMCVHPNLAALPETSGGLTTMYQYEDDHNAHAQTFYRWLDHAIREVNSDDARNYLRFVKAYADSRYNIDKISYQWESIMTELLSQYPDEKSRFLEKDIFVYKPS